MKEQEWKKESLGPLKAEKTYDLDAGTLANLRAVRRGPKYYKVGRRVLYKVSDLEAWLYGHPVHTIDSVKE
jgi:hypothetical protein